MLRASRIAALLVGLLVLAAGPTAASSASDVPPWLDLLQQRKYDQLEQELLALRENFVEGKCQECAATAPYDVFATSDPMVGQRIDEWIETHPDSLPARLARGLHRNHLSGLARGAASASETRPERFAEMERLQGGAIEDFAWVLERDKKQVLAYAKLIKIATAQGSESAAAQIYERALAANPESPAIHRIRAWSLAPWWQGRPWPAAMERLKAYLADLREQFGGRPGFSWLDGYGEYMDAEVLVRQGDLEGAIETYTKALALRESSSYLLARADAYEQTKQYDLRNADLQRALELSPTDGETLFQNGKVNTRLCRKERTAGAEMAAVCEDAINNLDGAIAQDPLDPEYLVRRAELLAVLGRYDDARRDFANVDVYGSYDPWAQHMMGSVLAGFDRPAAKLAYQRAVVLAPRDPYYVERYLDFLVRSGDCAFFEMQKAYLKLCSRSDGCRMSSDPEGMVRVFEQSRGRSCAGETWQDPGTTLVMPD